VQDNFNGEQVFMPPSALVLEQFAYSENVSEKWFAKAGFKRGRLLRSLGGQSASQNNQGDRDYMYSNGNAVNPIVNFQKEGPVIFGQRTLQRNASALDRLNVRDLMNYLKRSSAAAVRIDLFDPDDDILLGQITKRLTPIYSEVRAKRGINRFEVKFDSQTTTDINRDNNEVVGYIIVEPTKAAEKIILNFVVTAQGASFTEALAAAGVV
jgi:phage tail sheath protein FI